MPNRGIPIVRSAYEAFQRGDVAGIMELLAPEVEWRFVGAQGLAYTGRFTRAEVPQWFGHVAALDDIRAFEPREYIGAGEHVTVLGWERCAALPSGRIFESDWVHIFTVRERKITRFFGMYDTEASAKARTS
jgi:ketosteroid isomerase-like protein